MPSFMESLPRPVKTYHSTTYDRIAPTNFSLKGKTALVTGGATGIGYSISTSFAQAGISRIVILARSTGPLEKAKKELEAAHAGLKVDTYSASVLDYARVEEIVKEVSRIDVLVLNAADAHDFGPTANIPTEQVQRTYEINVIAPFVLTKAYLALPTPEGKSKTVINISSAGAHIAVPNQAGYDSSKTAFAHLLQHWYSEHGTGVRMFQLHPGAFYTQAVQRVGVKEDAFEWEDIRLPGNFVTWLVASGEAGFLVGRFLWAHWDVDELVQKEVRERVERDPFWLKIGLVL
jgi:NAD(P)-dependent dehydrogenase (short-subunit alcohol dehydrogenase family)